VPSDIRKEDFRRKFEKLGVKFEAARKHTWKMTKTVRGKTRVYIVPTKGGRYIKYEYVKKARKVFFLTERDGVSDERFESL